MLIKAKLWVLNDIDLSQQKSTFKKSNFEGETNFSQFGPAVWPAISNKYTLKICIYIRANSFIIYESRKFVVRF